MNQLVNSIHHLYHPSTTRIYDYIILLQGLQIIAITSKFNKVSKELNHLLAIIESITIFTYFDDQMKIIFIYSTFLFRTLIFLSIVCYIRNPNFVKILSQTLVIIRAFDIPLLLFGFEIMKDEVQGQDYIKIFAALNLFYLGVQNIGWLYFGRADSLEQESFYNRLTASISIRTLSMIMKVLSAILEQQLLLFICSISFIILNYVEFLTNIDFSNQIIGSGLVILLITTISLYVDLSITTTMIIFSLTLLVSKKINIIQFNHLLFNENVQINYIRFINQNRNFENKIFCPILIAKHNCQYNELLQILLKQMILKDKTNKQYQLLYSNLNQSKLQLRAVLNLQQNLKGCSYYFRAAFSNQITIYYQKLRNQKQSQDSEIDRQLLENINNIPNIIETFEKILRLQLELWNKLTSDNYLFDDLETILDSLQYNVKTIKVNFMYYLFEQRNVNIFQLRICQFYYCTVIYSPYDFKRLEDKIINLIKADHLQISNNISNQLLEQGKYLLLKSSLINNFGQLVDPNMNQIASFLEKKTFIQDIKDLMPQPIQQIHDQYIQNYINNPNTQKNKTILVLKPDGFLKSCKLKIDYNNKNLDDFVLSALLTSNEQQNNFILFDHNGKILGMDKKSQNLIKQLCKNIVSENYDFGFIQFYIKGIDKAVETLLSSYQINQTKQLNQHQDEWQIPQDYQSIQRFKSQHSSGMNFQSMMDKILDGQIHFQSLSNQKIVYDLELQTYIGFNLFLVQFMDTISDYKYEEQGYNHQYIMLSNRISISQEVEDYQSSKSVLIPQIQHGDKFKFIDSLTSRTHQQEQGQEQVFITFKDESQAENRRPEIIQINLMNQSTKKDKKQIRGEFDKESFKSKGSSQDKDDLDITKQIQQSTQQIKPMRKIILIMFLIILINIGIIMFCTLIIESHLQLQKTQVNNLQNVQLVNYLITSQMAQYYFFILQNQVLIELSPFIINYNFYQFQNMHQLSQQFNQLKLQADIAKQSEKYDMDQVVIILNDEAYDIHALEFYSIFQQIQTNDYLQYLNYQELNIEDFLIKGNIRRNLISITHFHDILIDNLISSSTQQQSDVINNYMYYIIVQIIIILIVFQFIFIWIIQMNKIKFSIYNAFTRISFQQANQQISRLKKLINIINYENWMTSNFSDQLFNPLINKSKDIQQNRQLSVYLPARKKIQFKDLIFFNLLLLINGIFILVGYIIYYQLNLTFQPSLASTFNFVLFRDNFDSLTLYGLLLKLDPLLSEIQQDEEIEQLFDDFHDYLVSVSQDLNKFTSQVYGSDLGSNQLFSNLLYYSLCQAYRNDVLIMCHQEKIVEKYYEKDDYTELISKGIVGYVEGFVKYINQEFSYELANDSYNVNLEETQLLIGDALFQNYFLQYFLDVQEMMRQFLLDFVVQVKGLADNLNYTMNLYYILGGIILNLLLIAIFYYWIHMNQKKMDSIRYLIGIIPICQRESQNFHQQIKQIHKSLF